MRRAWWTLDGLGVLAFVLIGRSAHHHGLALTGVVSTAWPFALGLVLGWLLVWRGALDGGTLRAGAAVCVTTVAVGMIARVIVGQGTAVAFVAVALAFLGAVMLGWRALRLVLRRRLDPGRTSGA